MCRGPGCIHVTTHCPDSVGKYECLVSGEAGEEVQMFLSETHTLAEYKTQIQHYRDLSAEITGLDDVILFDMFVLECHDIKHGLNEIAQNLITMLVKHLAQKHLDENQRCSTSKPLSSEFKNLLC